MSKRVSNKKSAPRVRPARSKPAVAKWVKRKPLTFDPVAAIDKLMHG